MFQENIKVLLLFLLWFFKFINVSSIFQTVSHLWSLQQRFVDNWRSQSRPCSPSKQRYKGNKWSNTFLPLHSAAQEGRGHTRASMKSEKAENVQFSIISLLKNPSLSKNLEVQKDKTLKMGMLPGITNTIFVLDIFLPIFKYGQHLLPQQPCIKRTKPHSSKTDGFIRNFYVCRETNENEILGAGRGKNSCIFLVSLSLFPD